MYTKPGTRVMMPNWHYTVSLILKKKKLKKIKLWHCYDDDDESIKMSKHRNFKEKKTNQSKIPGIAVCGWNCIVLESSYLI